MVWSVVISDVGVRRNLETGAGVAVAPTPHTEGQRVDPGEQNCSGDVLEMFYKDFYSN